jgi:hypothetical protein
LIGYGLPLFGVDSTCGTNFGFVNNNTCKPPQVFKVFFNVKTFNPDISSQQSPPSNKGITEKQFNIKDIIYLQ